MAGSDHQASTGRILVVEDDLVTGRFLVRLLGEHGGFDVTHTLDPAVGLKRASSEPWDLVLTDVEMPGMSGLELLEALRRVSPGLPVAVLTAHASFDYAIRALRDHADEFLSKSVPPEQLLASVRSLVAKGRAARLAARQVVLAIGAHPDDVEIGAAGALLVHRSMGHEVSILTLSRGARGGTESTRAGESEMAALALGATLFLDDLQDTRIEEGDPTIGVISRVVQTVRPSAIYTHSLHDVHQDHRNTHRAAMVAAREVGRVYCFQSPSATVDFRPNRFVTIDDEVERKLMAIRAFASQAEIRAYLAPDLIKSTARYWSRFGDGLYAEAFEVIREAAMTAGQPGGPVRNEAVALPGARPSVPLSAAARPDGAETGLARHPDDHPEVPYATP
jgi:two-component system, NtrC family, response regulator HydG